MTAAIIALAVLFLAWFAYQVGERIGERRGRVELDRLRRRLTDTRPDTLHRLEP